MHIDPFKGYWSSCFLYCDYTFFSFCYEILWPTSGKIDPPITEPPSFKGPCIYDVHTEGGWEGLEICHVFADSIVFKQ